MRPCLVLLYVCFVIHNINYCCSCSFYTATLYIELGPIFPMHASAAGVCACVGKREQPNDRDNLAGRANWSLLAERCLKSYCSVVSLFFRHVEELFRKSATERGRCCSTRTIISTIPVVLWSFNGSGRVVPCEHGCWTRTRRHNSSSRYLSSYADEVRLYTDPRRKHVIVVNVRLTARLQSLPLARCWPACFALFSSFPLLFRLTLTVVNCVFVCSGHYYKNELYELFVWRLIAKILLLFWYSVYFDVIIIL